MDDEEKLVEAVRCYPCLWQVSSREYKDARAKENAWKEVASQVYTKPLRRTYYYLHAAVC